MAKGGADRGEQGAQQARRGRQRGVEDTYTGRAAQLAVAAELLRLRCNAAIPEVDLGTDVLAFHEEREELARIQVKACAAPHYYASGLGYSAKFALPLKQLRQGNRPRLHYALAVLSEGKWIDFLIISGSRLREYLNEDEPFGSENKANDNLEITVEFRLLVTCSGRDLTDCRNAWHSLPPLHATSDVSAAADRESGPD